METKKDNTEDKIIDAATDVFVQKGMDGARMQEIADRAGINKALLHYYFRSKEKLFDAIFAKLIGIAFPRIGQILFSELPFAVKVEQAIDTYLDLLVRYPFLPAFIIKEMNRDATPFFGFVERSGFTIAPIIKMFQDAMDRGEIRRMKPEHLLVNIIALCVFPFAARPMIRYVAFHGDEQGLKNFLEERKAEAKEFVLKAIQPE
ncbi:TetR/AcrR family transcriptional regulator [Mangrovibacterium diazotrophicum]|uniref:TetR family transcriptional regulator n=1 Tax=Mangrovibacterium diazotrophicum TaxID=1261403 RepID=A0A419W6I0_9BACT|nr:TetR/AcrR family transcriptional regulator [Mangrovibacterium diazotrophicum]RKD91064.1 TetR family transcriptional regulator [Mangrovibacterium diazotrophicum]